MKRENKIALLGFSLGFVLFILLKINVFSKKGASGGNKPKKVANDQDMQDAGLAYQDALQNNAGADVLSALNAQFGKEYDIQVEQLPTGQLIITDMAGNKIATYQSQ